MHPDDRPLGRARLLALDWLRGLVMVVMAVDHCDAATNPDHCNADAAWMPAPLPLPVGAFLTRWCTHLCAPTFVFLCGVGMALSVARAEGRGERPAAIDRHWLARAGVLLLLEVTVVSFYLRFAAETEVVLQVLYAIGGCLMAMVALRRLPSPALLGLALLLPCATELLVQPVVFARGGPVETPFWNCLLWSGGFQSVASVHLFAIYPLLPWLTPMLLGFVLGRRLARGRATGALLAWGGLGALLLFALLRLANGFGNASLLRRDDSLLEWLHCSKYPPSAAFFALELGLMALLLAALVAVAARRGERPLRVDPLRLLGQTPLFFYLLHLPLIGLLAYGGVFPRPGSWPRSWLMALVVAALALPLCAWFRAHKARGARWARWL